MEVQKGKGGIYPLAIFVMVMLLNAYCCAGAAVVVESNTTTVRYNGGLDESLIEYDLELEYLMNPYISRILATPSPTPVYSALQAEKIPCHGNACSHGTCQKRGDYDRCWRQCVSFQQFYILYYCFFIFFFIFFLMLYFLCCFLP